MSTSAIKVRKLSRIILKSLLQVETGDRRTLSALSRAAADVILLSRFYYLFIVFAIASSILPFDRAYRNEPPAVPIWLIDVLQWITGTEWFANTIAVSAAGLSIALLALVFPRVLLWRLGVFLYVLLYVALSNSYGSINHGHHFYLYVSFTLLFLPSRDTVPGMSHRNTLSCLAVLWFTQTLVLLPYSLSGFWKIFVSRFELLASDGMVRILLSRAMDDSDNIGPLLPLVSQHDYLAQAMLLATVYVELFSILVVFRPHLHRLFGVLIILFHVGSDWIMDISFSGNILMIGLFVVLSPTAPKRFSSHAVLMSLPIVGIPFRVWSRHRLSEARKQIPQAWLVYDGECPLCKKYTEYLRIREAVHDLKLIDARAGGAIVDEVRSLPHDLNEGMVLKLDGHYYVGHEALNALALLSDKHGFFSRVNRLIFASRLTSQFVYPLLRVVRLVLLKIKGVARLDP